MITNLDNGRTMNRRNLLRLASTAAGLFWVQGNGEAAGHFWDTKLPSQWTPEEIAQLAANSPWAKQVTAQYRAAMDLDNARPRPGTELQQGRGEAKVGECGLVPCAAIMPGKVAVIWESAQPIREAIHPVIPRELNGRYVISVRGLEGDYSLERLASGSDLSAKGKPPVEAGLVRQRNNTYLFGFSKELMPLTAADSEVQFSVRTGANLREPWCTPRSIRKI